MFHQFTKIFPIDMCVKNKIFFELPMTEEEKAERARAMDEVHDFFRRKIQEDFDSIQDSLRRLSMRHNQV